MKNKFFCLIVCALIFITGCQSQPSNSEMQSKGTLSFLVKIDSVDTVPEAYVYSVKPLRFDEKILIDKVMQTPPTDTKIYATGKQFVSQDINKSEYLNIYDDGEAFGAKSGLDGGFSYGCLSDDFFDYNQKVIVFTSDYPDQTEQNSSWLNRKDYSNDTELSFMGKNQAIQNVQALFTKGLMPSIQVEFDAAYSLDLNTMKEHAIDYNAAFPEEVLSRMPEERDEAYFLIFRQEIDGIPLINQQWDGRTADEEKPHTNTRIEVLYTTQGVADISLSNAVEILDRHENLKLISPTEATAFVRKSYEKSILVTDVDIVKMELNYTAVYDKNALKLIPVWMFVASQEKEVKYELENSEKTSIYTEYTILLFDAATGTRITQAVM